MRIYRIARKVNENTNAMSRMMQSFVDKYLLKSEKGEK